MQWSKRLVAYLKKHGVTQLAFAHRVEVSPSQVHYWCNGAVPRDARRQEIELATGGEVSAELSTRATHTKKTGTDG